MRRRAAVALVGALVVGGCHAHLPPVVPAAPAAAAAPPLDPSLLVVDASADLATLAGTLDVLLALAGNDTRIEGLRLRRRPIGVKAVGDEVVLDVPLALEAGGAGRCGDRTLVLGWSIRLMPEVEATQSGASLRLAAPRVEAQGDDLSCLEGRAATVGGLVVLGAKAIEAALPALLEHLRVPLDGAVDATGRALATDRKSVV